MITTFARSIGAATTLLVFSLGSASAGPLGSFTSSEDSGHVQLNARPSGSMIQDRTFGAPAAGSAYVRDGGLGSFTSTESSGYVPLSARPTGGMLQDRTFGAPAAGPQIYRRGGGMGSFTSTED